MKISTVFTSRQACTIAGITHRQLDYWRNSGLVIPSQKTRGGHARYSFTDLVAIKTARHLLDAGVSLQKIRKNITALIKYLPHIKQPLTEISLVATGDVVLVLHEGSAFEALSGQEWIFPIARMHQEIQQLKQQKQIPIQQELFNEIGTVPEIKNQKISNGISARF